MSRCSTYAGVPTGIISLDGYGWNTAYNEQCWQLLLRMYSVNMSKASLPVGMNIKNYHEKMVRYELKKEEFK